MALRASRCYPVRAPQMNTEHCSDLKDQEVLRALAGCIDFDVLAPGLERNGVLTKSAVYKIKVEESLFERNLCLLQQLPRRGSWAYERFVDLLLENRMFQAAQALTQSKLPITPTPPNPRANGGRNVHHGLMHRMLWRAPLLLPVLSNNGAAATLDSRDDYLFPRMKFAFDEDIWGSQLAAAGTCACANGEAAPVDSSVTNPSRGTKCTYDEGIIWGRTLATTGACGKGDGPNTSGEASEAELRIARASCWKLGDHIYRMSRKPRGQCIIINNKEFGRHAEQRENSELDVYRMEALFTALHFECSVYSDISAKEMKALLSQAARQDQLDQVECFAAVLMSHGREDVIDGADGDELNLHSDVYELFSNENCPSLQGKPKLFFIQACRGDMLDRGVSCIAPATRNDHPLVTSSSLEWPAVCEYKHRMCSDMFIAYATAPGYVALKNMVTGSWFLSALYAVFSEHASTMHLEKLMRLVQRTVMARSSHDGGRQIPNMELIGWMKKLYFNPGLCAAPTRK